MNDDGHRSTSELQAVAIGPGASKLCASCSQYSSTDVSIWPVAIARGSDVESALDWGEYWRVTELTVNQNPRLDV